MESDIQPQAQEQKKLEIENRERKNVPIGGIILLVVLLIFLGFITFYFFADYSELGECAQTDDCAGYNVFYIKGEGYICGNSQIIEDSSIKTKILMFRYASKNAVEEMPEGCPCIQNKCEVE